MDPDLDLLRRYADLGDERALTELVHRKADLVHSAALRQVGGNAQLAQEVTQTVFLTLARKAGSVARHPVLTGWLFMTTRFVAARTVRAQQRWQNRVKEAEAMQKSLEESRPEPRWDELSSILDSAIAELDVRDREALLVRYFEDQPLAVVGERIGLSENSARMRVDRALDKLRAILIQRGVASTAGALGLLLTQHAVVAAPAEVAAAAARSALMGRQGGGFASVTRLIKACTVPLVLVGVGVLGVGLVYFGPAFGPNSNATGAPAAPAMGANSGRGNGVPGMGAPGRGSVPSVNPMAARMMVTEIAARLSGSDTPLTESQSAQLLEILQVTPLPAGVGADSPGLYEIVVQAISSAAAGSAAPPRPILSPAQLVILSKSPASPQDPSAAAQPRALPDAPSAAH